MGLIFWLSNDPRSSEETEQIFGGFNFWARKAAHMTEYGILFLLLYFALSVSKFPLPEQTLAPTLTQDSLLDGAEPSAMPSVSSQRSGSKMGLLALALTVLYACSDEWHQRFIPGRTSCVRDVVIDSLGALLALLVVTLARNYRRTARRTNG